MDDFETEPTAHVLQEERAKPSHVPEPRVSPHPYLLREPEREDLVLAELGMIRKLLEKIYEGTKSCSKDNPDILDDGSPNLGTEPRVQEEKWQKPRTKPVLVKRF